MNEILLIIVIIALCCTNLLFILKYRSKLSKEIIVLKDKLEADRKVFYVENTKLRDLNAKAEDRIRQAQANLQKHLADIPKIRNDAIKKSRNVIRGQATEHLAPLLQDDLQIADFRFIGDPVDYLICDGSSEVTDGNSDEIRKVILMEIKSGKSQLSKVQRRIRDAIVAGRVSFIVSNQDTNNIQEWKVDLPCTEVDEYK